MGNPQAACELHSALADMLEEYEYDTECHERAGPHRLCSQRAIILRAKKAIALFTGGPIERCYWESGDYEEQEDE